MWPNPHKTGFGFGYIYLRNAYWKTLFFVQCYRHKFQLNRTYTIKKDIKKHFSNMDE